MVFRILICLACLIGVDGVRISARLHAAVRSPIGVGAHGEPWVKGTKYVCMQKWQNFGSKFVNSFCLANYEKAGEIATAHFQVTKELALCASNELNHQMKLCALKGEAPEGRVSYSTKVHVAKSCFRLSSEGVAFPVVEAAVDERDCTIAMAESAEEQGVIQAQFTTATTTTTATEDILEDENPMFYEDEDAELFDVEAGNDTTEKIEAKALFKISKEKLWHYAGTWFKCCVSSAGKPTKLQDMNADIPAVRSWGNTSGCGYMFGDTYHNGPKHDGKCPVPLPVLKEITVVWKGDKFDVIKSLLEKEDSSPDRFSSFVEARATSPIGPDGEPWVQGTKYVCMQKWQTGGVTSKFVDSFCLANYAKAAEIATAHFQAKDLVSCASTKLTHQMKLCALKGKAPEGRLSYSTKVHVAKSCFRLSSEDAAFPVIEAAVDELDCTIAMAESAEEQGVIQAQLTTTTTTTTAPTEEMLKAGFDGKLEAIEAKVLFIAGDEKLWDYYGKAFKCCVSSAGKPTMLQDMLAEKMPAARSFGRRTGCGYMFGDTYHNGPKHHNRCPILLPVLRKITGGDFEEIKSYLST